MSHLSPWPFLLHWSENSFSKLTQTRAIVKVISKPVWDQGVRGTSTKTISIAVETSKAQERPLSSHKKIRLLRRAKTNTPTLPMRHWGTDYEAGHKTNHVPWIDNNSETTLRAFKLWSPWRGFFVVFTQTQTACMNFFSNPVSCFHLAFYDSVRFAIYKQFKYYRCYRTSERECFSNQSVCIYYNCIYITIHIF